MKILFLCASFFLSFMRALAHNGIDDGDSAVAAISPTNTERAYVAAGLAVFILVAALVIWLIRRKK
jgi:hypothetical protein